MFKMILKDLRIAPMRTVLMALSVFIGISAVIAAVLAGTIGKAYLIGINNQRFGRSPHYRATFNFIQESQVDRVSDLYQRIQRANKHTALVMNVSNNVVFCTTRHDDLDRFQRPSESLNDCNAMETVYTTSRYSDIFSMPLQQGTWFSDDANQSSMSMVINQAATQYFSLHSLVSRVDVLQRQPALLRIVGVVNDGVNTPKAYVNLLPFVRFARYHAHYRSGEILWYDHQTFSEAKVRSILNDALVDAIHQPANDISVARDADAYESVISALQIGFGLCATLLLFVAALGLISIGLASLEQRAHELLIRRSLGATRLSISILVLGSSLSIVLIASIAAILISYAGVLALPMILSRDIPITIPTYPIPAAVAAMVAALVTALIGGIIPAIRASRLQPALVLR